MNGLPPFPILALPPAPCAQGSPTASQIKESIHLKAAVFQPGHFSVRIRCVTNVAVEADRAAQQEWTDRPVGLLGH